MKAVLVQPPVFWTTTPPLGPAYLAAELRRAGDDVRLLDLNIELFAASREDYRGVVEISDLYGHSSSLRRVPTDELPGALAAERPREAALLASLVERWAERVLSCSPDLVGLSIHVGSLLAALLLAREIRRSGSPAILVAGGPEAIFLARRPDAVARGVLDAVVVGEGEGPFRELARRVRSGEIAAGRPGLGERPLPGALVRSEKGTLLDAVEAPDRALVPIEDIALPSFDGLPLDLYSFPRTFPIVASRGCVARCTFCFETVMWKRFRIRSVESVVDEIRRRLAEHGEPLSFRFNDSLLNGDLDWLGRFADAVLAAGIETKWHGNARIHPKMTPAYLEKLARAGLTGFLYGVESGSERILRRMKKGVRAADIPAVLENTHRAGLWTHAFLILDFPGEGDREALETLDLLLGRLGSLDSLVFHDFHLPGELVEYLDFPGRVPLDDSMALAGPRLAYQSNVAALRPWLHVFLDHFLVFPHSHRHVHTLGVPAAHARALLAIYRERWCSSPDFARARMALAAARAVLARLHEGGWTALLSPGDEALPLLAGRKILPRESVLDPDSALLSRVVYATRAQIAAAVAGAASRWPVTVPLPEEGALLEDLAAALGPPEAELALPATAAVEAPEGFR